MTDEGLALLRIAIGLLLVAHGSQKLFGWFGGYGLRGTGGYLESLGYRPGVLFACLAGVGEAGGGLLLALGIATPVAAALVIATMVNVYAGHAGKGLWSHEGGWELSLVYGVVAASLALTGPGVLSLDAEFGWLSIEPWWGIAAVAGGAAAGVITLATCRRNPTIEATSKEAAMA